MKRNFYSVSEFAEATGYSTDRVYEWVRTQRIQATKVTDKGNWLIPASELERLQKKGDAKKALTYDVRLQKHFEKLSVTALTLASNLESYLDNSSCRWVHEVEDVLYGGWVNEIGDGIQSFKTREVDKSVALNLLYHLKDGFPELTDIKDWAELTSDKITNDFVERLRLKASRVDFMGKCPAYPT